MNILVLAHFQNDSSPCAVFVHDQVKAFQRLGHKVLVVSMVPFLKNDFYGKKISKIAQFSIIDSIAYYHVRFLSLSNLGSAGFNQRNAIIAVSSSILNSIKRFHPDIVHAHTFELDAEIGVWLKTIIRCPLVITTHGSDTVLPIIQGKQKRILRICSKADYVVCVGSKLKNKLLSIGATTNTSVIHNGFNLQFVDAKQPKKPKSIIQVGNLVPSKRNDITIKAFSIIKQKHPESTLTIIGDGPEKEKLIELCKNLNISDSVFFLGKKTNKEVLEKMALSEFFVMVSSPEGFGIVYLEAMASKCITLAAENEGISDIIVPGINGFLLPVDNPEAIASKVLWSMDNPNSVKHIPSNAYNEAIKYSWDNNALNYQKVFENLISREFKNNV